MRRSSQVTSLASAFDGLRSDYAASKSSRFRRSRTVPGNGAHADYHYRTEADYLRLLEYARDMDRNDIVVGQTIDRAVTNTIQGGFTLDPMTGDPSIDLDLWQRFEDWATDTDSCTVDGETTWYQVQYLALRHMLVDGDVFVLPTDGGALQMVESHRCRTPTNTSRKVVLGVMLDDLRRRLEYWFLKDDVSPMQMVSRVGDIQRYPARDADGNQQVFHLLMPKRITQTRGISALSPVFDAVGMHDDIQFAKLVQQQVVSCFAVFREVPDAQDAPAGQLGEETEETLSDGSTRVIQGIAPGLELTGRPGEKLHGFSPAVPNAEFFMHVKLILTLIGVNLGVPRQMLLMDNAGESFSSWRGSMEQAKMGFRRNQKAMIDRLHTRVYRWLVRRWIQEDSALRAASMRSGVNIFRHKWTPPSWPYIQPLEDAQAAALRIERRLSSPRRIAAEQGADYDDVTDEVVADNARAIRLAVAEAAKIASETGTTVDWHELLYLSYPGPLKLQPAAPENGGTDATGA